MQHHTHNKQAPRFIINARGILIDRQAVGGAQRASYSVAANRVSRTDMQILADMLNEPAEAAEWDAGRAPDVKWLRRIAECERHGARNLTAAELAETQRAIAAWNAMTEAQRAAALQAAGSACPADAMRNLGYRHPTRTEMEVRHAA